MRRVASLAYSVAARVIIAMGGVLAGYGGTGMFTTAGIMPPNLIVIVGVAAVILGALAMWTKERRFDGIWAALPSAFPYAAYAWGSWSHAECAADHPPITPTFSCAPVGTHAIAIVAPLVAIIAVILVVRDVRALARGIARSQT